MDDNGTVANVTVVQPAGPQFDAAVVERVRRWKYQPAHAADGRPVASEVKVGSGWPSA